jgi:hypothetical protein
VDVQITSINASGESVKSDALTLQAASHPDAPATPTETAITQEEYSDSTLKIQVSWVEPANNGAAITGYQLWMSKQSLDFEMVYDGASRSDVLTYLVENQILRSTSYNFKVRAINRIGYSSFSPVLKSFAAVVPSTPLGFHHTDSQSGSISLAWDSPLYDGGAALTGYYIYYKVASDTSWSKTTLVTADLHQETVGSLTPDTQYSLKIVAVNEKGESVQSGIMYQYASAVPTLSQEPVIVGGSRTETSLMVNMAIPDSSTTTVLGYQLFANDANSNAVPTNLVYDGQAVANVLQVSVLNLESSQGYWLAYRVLNRAGWSELSPYLKLVAGKLPQAPAMPPHQISVSPSEITFGWSAPSDIGGASKLDGYYVYEGSTLIGTTDPDTLTFSYASVTAGQSYVIQVSAFSAIGEGGLSNPLTIWAIDVPS